MVQALSTTIISTIIWIRTTKLSLHVPILTAKERKICIDDLLVRTHFIIEMIWWTGLAPWEFEFPFPGSLTSTFPCTAIHLIRMSTCIVTSVVSVMSPPSREIGILLPNSQRQRRTWHAQKDVLPYALCYSLCPVATTLARICRTAMNLIRMGTCIVPFVASTFDMVQSYPTKSVF